ncbi:MAG: hypothetical protein EXQ88_01075 [Alphaproteobacteria bacterium]|nr:hypothetical protein [Alphaproteobacteria bacterium]
MLGPPGLSGRSAESSAATTSRSETRAKKRKYQLPAFLEGRIPQPRYEEWLHRKAAAHVKRDRRRGNRRAAQETYKVEIHQAVRDSAGMDFYTGEALDWLLISKYNNNESKKGGRQYKAKFSLLPTVDHVNDGLGLPDFKICSWRFNDAKNDLSLQEFIELCKKSDRA